MYRATNPSAITLTGHQQRLSNCKVVYAKHFPIAQMKLLFEHSSKVSRIFC